jgi:DNA adenine methylase
MDINGSGLFSRQGGKYRQRKIILEHFPPTYAYDTYVEPFLGGGSIAMEAPRVKTMIAGDTDPAVISTFKDFKKAGHLIKNMDFTPDKDTFEKLKASNPTTPAARLYKELYLSFHSYAGNKRHFSKRNSTGDRLKSNIDKYMQQLAPYTILKRDYSDLIKKYDSPTTFFYLDPPYYGTDTKPYATGNIDHEKLAEMLRNISGYFMLSHNDTPYIRNLYDGFRFFKYISPQANIDGGERRVPEVLITNYKIN